MRLAYIVSRYPYVSHVFILREVLALREAGVEVHTFTVRRPELADLRSAEDREAYATTPALVPAAPARLMAAHVGAFLTAPGRYLRTLRLAMSLRTPGIRSTVWQLFYFAEAALLWMQCRRRGVRHIHAHHANVASDVALLAAHLGGPDWSWSFTMHGSTEFFDVREHRLAQKVSLARFVVCVSEHGRSQLMTHVQPQHWEKLHVVHCGIDPGRFPLIERSSRSGEVEVLTVGRLVPVKGQALLVEALAGLRREGREVRLTIVGDGPELPPLRELADGLGVTRAVSFPGAVGQEEILDFYARADVFALPSFAEGLPVVLIEAMATGLPVVASGITGIPELVRDGVTGRLVIPGRVEPLRLALAELVEASSQRRAQMGQAARQRVLEEFDLRQSAVRLRGIYASYLDGSSPG